MTPLAFTSIPYKPLTACTMKSYHQAHNLPGKLRLPGSPARLKAMLNFYLLSCLLYRLKDGKSSFFPVLVVATLRKNEIV